MYDFYFMGQKIVNLAKNEYDEYELLLRSHSVSGFPEALYEEATNTEEHHRNYLNFLAQALPQILEMNPNSSFSFNLDQQELEYAGTYQLLNLIKPDLRDRLIIEITENPATDRKYEYSTAINVEAFKAIHELGYKIALDDMEQGNNSIGNFLLIKDYLTRIKWSLVHVRNILDDEQVTLMIQLLNTITIDNHLDLVIEGIEKEDLSDWLKNHNITIQQGYLFAKPSDILPIPLLIDEREKIID